MVLTAGTLISHERQIKQPLYRVRIGGQQAAARGVFWHRSRSHGLQVSANCLGAPYYFMIKLPFNWFDLLLAIALMVGVRSGRKHGMSEELLKLLKWVGLMLGCAFLYQPVGMMICDFSPVFNTLNGYIIAYVFLALIIAAAFSLLKKWAGEKLVSSETFGRSEFYLGMFAGMARFGCMVIMAMALLNARNFGQAEIQADIKYQNDVYGSNFFPQLYTIQSQVFKRSMFGPWIKSNLGFLLIQPTVPEKKDLKQKEIGL
jgi:uncharacterized membrane protein required for colicin V production